MKRKSNRQPSDAQWNDGPGKGRVSVDTHERKPPKNMFVVSAEDDNDDADDDILLEDGDDLTDELNEQR